MKRLADLMLSAMFAALLIAAYAGAMYGVLLLVSWVLGWPQVPWAVVAMVALYVVSMVIAVSV